MPAGHQIKVLRKGNLEQNPIERMFGEKTEREGSVDYSEEAVEASHRVSCLSGKE